MIHTIINNLLDFGYDPILNEYETYYDIKFTCFGFNDFKDSEKNTIIEICGDYLMELYYGGNTQHIYIKKNIKLERLKKLEKLCQKYS